jgi:hypothetical protein
LRSAALKALLGANIVAALVITRPTISVTSAVERGATESRAAEVGSDRWAGYPEMI